MDRRTYLALASTALLAGCRSLDQPAPSPTSVNETTATPTTATEGTVTETDGATETDTATETETATQTRRPNPESAEELDEARRRLNTAIERYADESHRPLATSMLETTADSEGFTPSRVTGVIEDARLSLQRAEDGANESQQSAVDALRDFADWLEGAVSVQTHLVASAVECRTALSGSVPHDDRQIQSDFRDLSDAIPAARTAVDSLSPFFGDVSDGIEALDSGDVRTKTEQLRSETETLETFAGYGESIVDGIDMLRRARGVNYATAIELAEDAIDEFESVETAANVLGVPDSLSTERDGFVGQATDWREHAEDRLDDYRDAKND